LAISEEILLEYQRVGKELSRQYPEINLSPLCTLAGREESAVKNRIQYLEEKREEILRIASRYGAKNIRLFGSTAKGEAGPTSDIDFLIDLEPGRSLLDIVAIKQELEDLLGVQVDVVTEAAISPFIRDEVVEQAVNL
jgi:uncharacterized protein